MKLRPTRQPASVSTCRVAIAAWLWWAWVAQPSAAGAIDVALGPQGTLVGQVLCVGRDGLPAAASGLTVTLLEGGRTIASTRTDAGGRFAVAGLRGGLYCLVTDTVEGPRVGFYRLWTSQGAPPHALSRATVTIARGAVRGQSPPFFRRLPPGAAIVALTAGAIAPPIIYSSVKRDEHIPKTP